jgi:hypothetical protein
VAKYMAKRRRPPGLGRTFVHNHAATIALIDMFEVPTWASVWNSSILRQSRRELLNTRTFRAREYPIRRAGPAGYIL